MNPYSESIHQSGFTLLEVMITIVILGLGIMGLAALQFSSLRANNQSLEQSQATALAYELADIMRANAARANAGDFDAGSFGPAPAEAAVDCQTSVCTAQQLAAFELNQWYQRMVGTLPRGMFRVVRSASPCPATGCMHTVSIMWDEERTGETPEELSEDPTADCDPLFADAKMTCIRISFLTQASLF